MWTEPVGIAVLEEFAERAFREQYDSGLRVHSWKIRKRAPARERKKAQDRTCVVCGKVFPPKGNSKRCSVECVIEARFANE